MVPTEGEVVEEREDGEGKEVEEAEKEMGGSWVEARTSNVEEDFVGEGDGGGPRMNEKTIVEAGVGFSYHWNYCIVLY